MAEAISKRLRDIVDALPLRDGLRVVEIGCGTGSAAREIAKRIKGGYILRIDRSKVAITKALESSQHANVTSKMDFIHSFIENFELPGSSELFDIAFAVRVGALDGRHPEIEAAALKSIKALLKPGGKLFVDGGNPLKEVNLSKV